MCGNSSENACGRARACGQQNFLQHHERLLRNKQNSDGPCFNIRNERSNEFLFRAASQHLNVSHSQIGAAFLRVLTTQTDVSTVTKLYVSRMFRTIWPTLHRVSCSNQSSKSESRRSGATVSFQLPSGKLQTTTLQTRIYLTRWKKKKGHLVLQVYSRQHNLGETKGARACLFLLLFFLRRVILIVWEGMWCFAGSAALKARSSVSALVLGGRPSS